MLRIKTVLKFSPIHGLGCFSMEPIKKGQLVWTFDSGSDLVFDEHELLLLPEAFREFLKTYGYVPLRLDKKETILCADHARHMNHSEDPSLLETPEGHNIAARDIAIGEELTCDYREFDKEASEKIGDA